MLIIKLLSQAMERYENKQEDDSVHEESGKVMIFEYNSDDKLGWCRSLRRLA